MTIDHTLQLAEALQRRTLALFIGADLPREVTGLPFRADLARDLARRKGLDGSFSLAQVLTVIRWCRLPSSASVSPS